MGCSWSGHMRRSASRRMVEAAAAVALLDWHTCYPTHRHSGCLRRCALAWCEGSRGELAACYAWAGAAAAAVVSAGRGKGRDAALCHCFMSSRRKYAAQSAQTRPARGLFTLVKQQPQQAQHGAPPLTRGAEQPSDTPRGAVDRTQEGCRGQWRAGQRMTILPSSLRACSRGSQPALTFI